MSTKINIFFYVFFTLISISCNNTKNKKNNVNHKINNLTNINSYNIKKEIINDTIIKINGENKNYNITGYLNVKRNKKDNWWKVTSKDNAKILDVEYILIDNNERKNQIIFYENNKIDTAFSKFYTEQFVENPKNIRISFYLPKSKGVSTSAKFDYNIINDKKITRFSDVNLIKKNGRYFCNIYIDKYENEVALKGIFKEFSVLHMKDSAILGASIMLVEIRN